MTTEALPTPGRRNLSDREALDQLAIYMGAQEQWNGGDVCELAASLLEATGRPPVGDQSEQDLAMYRRLCAGLGWQHDGDDQDHDQDDDQDHDQDDDQDDDQEDDDA